MDEPQKKSLSLKAQAFVSDKLWLFHLIWIVFCIYYLFWAVKDDDPSWISRAGGMSALIGLLMSTIATARKDLKLWTGLTSEDVFYKHGFIVSYIGTLVWALGDILSAKLIHWAHPIAFPS